MDSTFAALADPTRRAILASLAEGEKSVGTLAEPHDMSLAAVSKHIRVLGDAGLVSQRKDGRSRFCRLEPDRLAEASRWFEDYRRFWETSLDKLDRLTEPKTSAPTERTDP